MTKNQNQFGPTTGTATAGEPEIRRAEDTPEFGEPGDENTTPAAKLNKDGSTRKVRGPSGPRTVNPKIEAFRAVQNQTRAAFDAQEKAAWKLFIENLNISTKAEKMAARLEKKLLDMSPAEKAWMAKATADQLAVHADPEPEQREETNA